MGCAPPFPAVFFLSFPPRSLPAQHVDAYTNADQLSRPGQAGSNGVFAGGPNVGSQLA